MALQLGFVQPSVVLAAKMVFKLLILVVPFPRIIPCTIRVDMISVDVVIKYKEGMTGNHFGVVGTDLIIITL